MTTHTRRAGEELANRLGIETIKAEGHDLVCACALDGCTSSDGGRVHADTGVYHCYVCNESRSPYQLALDILKVPRDAMQTLIAVGLAEDENGNGNGNGHTHKLDLLDTICKAKRFPRAAIEKYGATITKRGRLDVVRIDVYGENGKVCSHFDLTPEGKGLLAQGQPSGLFFPGRTPKAGEKWLLVEGAKDCAALTDLGYLAAGTCSNRMNAKFARLFQGVHLTIIPDRDKAGDTGAEETAAILKGRAASIKRCVLPIAWQETGGADVRDVLALKDGEKLLRQAIDDALPWGVDPQEPLPIVPISQLKGQAAVPWVWFGYLAAGYTTLFIGLWKAGKTTLLSHLLAMAERGGHLGEEVLPFRALVITEENSSKWMERRDRLNISDNILFLESPPFGNVRPAQKDWEEFIARLVATIKEQMLQLVIFDPLASFAPWADENDSAQMMAALTPLRSLNEAGAAVMILHHPNKADSAEGRASRGSGALPGFVDVILEMRRFAPNDPEDRRRTLVGLSRFDETPRELVLELNDDGYQALGTKEQARATADAIDDWGAIQDAKAAIMAALGANPQGLSKTDIAKKAGMSRSKTFQTAMDELALEGSIDKCTVETGPTKRKDPGFRSVSHA